jgi:hypothetical protein
MYSGERIIAVEHTHSPSSGMIESGVSSYRPTGTSSSVPTSPNRGGLNEQIYSTTDTTQNIVPSIGENGSVFTLTNIYTFGGDDNSISSRTDQQNPSLSDGSRVKSFVEVFNQSNETEYERHYRETHSSSSVTRKVHTSATDTFDYDDRGNSDSARFPQYQSTTYSGTTRNIPGKNSI